MGAIIIIAIVIYVVYMIATKEQRAEKKEQKRQEREQKKQEMLSDPFIQAVVHDVCALVTDLKNAPVKVLRTGGEFYLVFQEGSVYYETRWMEGSGDNRQLRKNTQCIVDRIDLGKNPLSHEDNLLLRELVSDQLEKISWMSVQDYGREIKVSKAPKATIPEAF